MGNCYSGDNIAEAHIHTDITTCTIEEPQRKYRLGTIISNRLLGLGRGWGRGLQHVLLNPKTTFLYTLL